MMRPGRASTRPGPRSTPRGPARRGAGGLPAAAERGRGHGAAGARFETQGLAAERLEDVEGPHAAAVGHAQGALDDRARVEPGGARAISSQSFSSKNLALTAKPQLPRTTLTGCGAWSSLPYTR